MVSLTMYVLLSGADFGAGVWELFAKGATRERQLHLIETTITPIWEVNHIWLVFVLVLLFSGFPTAFAALMSALFVPVLLMLIGILFRGAAFAFRAPFAPGATAQHVLARVFAVSSLLTPVFMGIAFGTIAQTNSASAWSAETNGAATEWLTPFSVITGLLAVALFAQLAAVYLLLETSAADLRRAFRFRALGAGAFVLLLAIVAIVIAEVQVLGLWRCFQQNFLARVSLVLAATSAALALAALWRWRFRVAQIAVISQTVCLLWAVAIAQYPNLGGPGQMPISANSSPANVMWSLLWIAGLGMAILVPAMLFLLRTFKAGLPKRY
jgi:cytochrome d ubiquinol oxidase subunit II